MALPISVPYSFANATTSIPLSQLDTDISTIYATVNGIGNGTVALSNVVITGGIVSNVSGISTSAISNGTSNVSIATANGNVTVSTANTTAMTIDTSQNVGIGTSSPGNKLDVAGNQGFSTSAYLFSYAGGTSAQVRAGFYMDGTNQLVSVYTGTNERMRIDSSGNVGIGTSSIFSGAKLDVAGAGAQRLYVRETGSSVYGKLVASTTAVTLSAESSNPLIFGTADTERARIDSNGRLLVGLTSGSSGGKVSIQQNDNSNDNSYSGLDIYKGSATTSTAQVFQRFFINNGTANGSITANGASNAAFTAYSDAKLKENIVNLPAQLANILALRPVEFDYKGYENGEGHQIGFIAQEMQGVYPDVVNEGEDGMLTVTGWSKTEARLVAAIQELSAKNNALEARLAKLESKQ